MRRRALRRMRDHHRVRYARRSAYMRELAVGLMFELNETKRQSRIGAVEPDMVP